MIRLLRPHHTGIFSRSFRLHSTHYARETIAKICSPWFGLATAIISQTGSYEPIAVFRKALTTSATPRGSSQKGL